MKLRNRIKQQFYLMIHMIRNSAAPPELESVSGAGFQGYPKKNAPMGERCLNHQHHDELNQEIRSWINSAGALKISYLAGLFIPVRSS
jgi:hypothetical protein